MISKSHLLLALGVAGLALFTARGKSRKMTADGDNRQDSKDLTSWEGRNVNLPSTIVGTSTNSSSPPM
ncbi:MAG: hypothetical protein ABI476_02505 [Oxalobacteraceae bacterium]